jgi:hypothetical protein
MNENFETRNTQIECRALDEGDKRYIEGYAILYNHRSKLIFERGSLFYEEIKRGAIDEVLKSVDLDVIASPNHNYSQILGRTKSKTLELIEDEKGLRYKVEIPNTTFGNDIYESIKRGDTFESSFTFFVDSKSQNWSKDGEGNDLRTIEKINILKEVGPVTWGAYSDTIVAARCLEDVSKETPNNLDLFKKKLQILKIRK